MLNILDIINKTGWFGEEKEEQNKNWGYFIGGILFATAIYLILTES